ncbi:hypothetical protein AA0114_g6338 [Alternaria tenuissima]|jgi:hypothetical protein|uniref:Uncharacterized protein n=1 Tax=Alternaria tenuissima TaxID=119927 RepID=A0A4Q4MEW8_9PLEO|nr:hypothetical protein AA0114_g6338 [Alternaria tenuissima]
MRLIDAARLELCSFMDDSHIPPYAILSHTWGPDEVTLQQFTDLPLRDGHHLKDSHGHWKIIKACQQALQDGIRYVWVDTCCIDKTSSAELSEAINSMFRWYEKADVCYAYLDDVNVFSEAEINDSTSNDRFSKDELAKSRWFTRGWTLQELIAPEEIVFYGKHWRRIDEKASMCAALERMTGISVNVLAGTDRVEDQSIAKRMSWMAGRTTTRTEDMAYSLMGIFDVNMPLLYGEGNKAFVRLQEEIMKDSADHSLFAWNEPLPNIFVWPSPIFANHPKHFRASSGIVNRRFDDKDRLEEEFSSTNRGIKIKLRIRRPITDSSHALTLMDDHFLAVLDCCFEDPKFENCWPSITVRRLTGSKSQYMRVPSHPIVPVVFGQVSDAQKLFGVVSVGEIDSGEWIYLRKKIPGWAFESAFLIKRQS